MRCGHTQEAGFARRMKQKRERAEPSLASRCRRCFACCKRWFHITGEKSGCLGHPTNTRVTNGPSSNPSKGTWLHSFLWTPGTNCHPAYLLRPWERRARVYPSCSPLLGRQPTLPYWLPPQVPQSSLDRGAVFGQGRTRSVLLAVLSCLLQDSAGGEHGGGGERHPLPLANASHGREEQWDWQRLLTRDAEPAACPSRWILPAHPPTCRHPASLSGGTAGPCTFSVWSGFRLGALPLRLTYPGAWFFWL